MVNEAPDLDMHVLTEKERENLEKVKIRFPAYEEEGLGKTHLMEHKIELKPGAKPIKQKYFSISPAIEKLVNAEIDEMLELEVKEVAPNCPWSSPVVLVKRNNKARLCLDSCKMNDLTIKDAYPLPHIEGILSRRPEAEFISSLDLRRAFSQFPYLRSPKTTSASRYLTGPFIGTA